MSVMHYVFHPNHEAVVVPTEEYQKYLDSGWYDTPAKFPANALKVEEKPEVAEAPAESLQVSIDVKPKRKGRPPKVKQEYQEVAAQG